MLRWFRREPPAQPKEAREFPDVVVGKLAQMNRLQAAEHRYGTGETGRILPPMRSCKRNKARSGASW